MYGRLMVVLWELVSVLGGGKKTHTQHTVEDEGQSTSQASPLCPCNKNDAKL